MPNLVQVEGNVPYDREALDVFTVKWIYVCLYVMWIVLSNQSLTQVILLSMKVLWCFVW